MQKAYLKNVELPRILPIMVAVCVALLTIVLWQALNARENAQIKLAVEKEAIKLRTAIKERLDPQINELDRLASHWEMRGGMAREDWEADSTLSVAQNIGQRGVSWVDPSYHVQWSVPKEIGRLRIGVYVDRDEQRSTAMAMALERKQLWVSQTLELGRGGRGILVFAPLFVDERFDGFLVASFGTQELLDSLVSEQTAFGYAIAVFDDEEKIASRSDTNGPDHPEWLQETAVEIRNAAWRVQVWPGPELATSMRSSLPEMVLPWSPPTHFPMSPPDSRYPM